MKNIILLSQTNYSPNFIVFFRVAIGLIVMIHFLSYWQDFEILYGKYSIIPSDLQSVYFKYPIISFESIIHFISILFSEDYSVLVFKIIFISLCCFIILGFFSRISALLLLMMQVSYIKEGVLLHYGVDFFSTISLFYIFIFPSSSYYSLQLQFFPKSVQWLPKQSIVLCKWLIQSHLCIAYFFSGLDKILGFNWWNGESVWKALHLPNFTHFIEIPALITDPIFYVIMGWFTILTELLYPIFINIKRSRKLWLLLTIGMHLGIIICFNLFFFSAIMIVWNLTAYYFDYYENNNI